MVRIHNAIRDYPLFNNTLEGVAFRIGDNGMDSPFADGIVCATLEDPLTSLQHKGGVLMNGSTLGIDIAKNVFEVCMEDGCGAVVERKRLAR